MTSSARKLIVIGAAGVALAAAGIFPAYALAAPTVHHRRLGNERVGTVSSIDGSSITFAARDGAIYTVDAQDAKIFKAGSTSSLSSVAVGDAIAVIGPVSGHTIAARAVIDGPVMPHARHGVILGGTITSSSIGSFVLQPKGHPNKPARAPITVNTDASTTIVDAGKSVDGSALVAGANVIVSGTREATSTLLATKIIIRKPR